VVDLAEKAGSADSVHSVSLPHHRSIAEDDEVVALGRKLFHGVGDRRVAKDGRACASCHPEGRDDGLVWSTPNGPRQTPMLAGRTVGTGPYSWLGDSATVADHLEHTIARLGGKGLPKSDRDALAKYLAVMPEPPRSFSPESTEARDRGAAIFASAEAGCSSCHGARGDDPDGMAHDVKSKASADRQREFDTPSLKFIGGTAPYFHDGRYPDLRMLLTKTNGKMGHTSHLSEEDFDALTAFLRTL
jgi:cytochrome c peroxidase